MVTVKGMNITYCMVLHLLVHFCSFALSVANEYYAYLFFTLYVHMLSLYLAA